MREEVTLTVPEEYDYIKKRINLFIEEINTSFVDTPHANEMIRNRDALITRKIQFEHDHPEVLI